MRTHVVIASLGAVADQPTRLRITNGCQSEPMWIASQAAGGVGPGQENVKVARGASVDFPITDGLSATRFWPKLRCNSEGQECELGDSGGPGQTCRGSQGCAPPVDSKFEATFGAVGGAADYFDASMVDGWSLPFKLQVFGDCSLTTDGSQVVDCSHATVDKCPSSEAVAGIGNLDLRVRDPSTGAVVGCYSPCGKLTYSNWNNKEGTHTVDDPVAAPYCCPTPPVSPDACRTGPVPKSQYVAAVHEYCPGVYGYAYDDGAGLCSCPAGTKYEMTFFCPGDLSSTDSTEPTVGCTNSTTADCDMSRMVVV
eukprot:CAMPEP_0204321832 /NCGR_PEP_ID=MMETSP0469-20131031/8370_1 /ASSEMBLY_ACC=CAM_ASM_000384 /TAXON_ID=2969 /ORGANISM="Oxyrrhis marina" /LENGTH=309 /DNA_ID=CAMNT_0051303155 /DNA_START=28 /DNA_END=957 /DNA_ORIENTATION=-